MKENSKIKDKGRVGVYICYCGGNISDHVEVEEVRNRIEKLPNVAVARTDMFMCSDPGQEMIIEDIKKGNVDRVVVASCSPSLHEITFRGALERAGANPFIYEHANIREQVSWVHQGKSATDKASTLVAAAVAKAEHLKPLEPIKVEAKKHVAIIGGGVSGLKSAIDIAELGIKAAVIEQSHILGGQLNNLDRLAPTNEKASEVLEELLKKVLNHKLITVYTNSRVKEAKGYVGNFSLTVEKDSKDKKETFVIDTGSIVLSTGSKLYTPFKGEFGFREHKEVITLSDLILILKENRQDGSFLEIDGRKIRSIAMIHCVGSRHIPGIHEPDEEGNVNEYCSRICCSAMLNASNMIKERFSETEIFEMYRDIRTYGRGQEELYYNASKNNVVFMRFEADAPPQVRKDETDEYPLQVSIKDTLTFEEEIKVPADLIVLATGVVPNDISDLVAMMKLPVGADRFLSEVHPKLRPVEFQKAGIFLAGTCQAPMDSGEACNAGGAAAVKAAALLGKGYIELDPFVAEVDSEKCQGCGECKEVCLSEGALSLIEVDINGQKVKKAQVTAAICLGCGACVAVCPENAIDINGWTLKQYEKMVDAIVADDLAV
jgi:heterodisulfide reductase subunit A2